MTFLTPRMRNLIGFCFDPMLELNHNSMMESQQIKQITPDHFWIVSDGFYTWIYTVVQMIIGLITVFANILVICSVFAIPKRNRLHHKYSKASLALADGGVFKRLVITKLANPTSFRYIFFTSWF